MFTILSGQRAAAKNTLSALTAAQTAALLTNANLGAKAAMKFGHAPSLLANSSAHKTEMSFAAINRLPEPGASKGVAARLMSGQFSLTGRA